MKQIILTLLLFFPLSLMAQEETSYEYQPLVVDGKTWTTLRTVDEKWTYLISGDTIFNGHECKKLLLYVDNTANNYMYNYLNSRYKREGDAFIYAYIYEENKKVYATKYPQTPYQYRDFYLLYDFSMEEGDQYSYFVVGKVFTIEYHGIKRRMMHIYSNDYDINELWVEGVGTIIPFTPGYSGAYVGYTGSLLECMENGEVIFTGNDFVELIQTNDIEIPTKKDNLPECDSVYDMQGRRVTTPQKGGIYIRNGRKFLWK